MLQVRAVPGDRESFLDVAGADDEVTPRRGVGREHGFRADDGLGSLLFEEDSFLFQLLSADDQTSLAEGLSPRPVFGHARVTRPGAAIKSVSLLEKQNELRPGVLGRWSARAAAGREARSEEKGRRGECTEQSARIP